MIPDFTEESEALSNITSASGDKRGLVPERREQSEELLPCLVPGCKRVGQLGFKNEWARKVHVARSHQAKKKHKTSPSNTRSYKRNKYVERRDALRARGLTYAGTPFRQPKPPLSKTGLKNIRRAQEARREREKAQKEHLLNGASTTINDNLGETARAILLTAQVLRSVSLGLKL